MKKYGKPQGAQSKFNSLCPPKEFPLKDITGQVILEIKATKGMKKTFEAQLLTYMKAMEKMVGLLMNFNVERLEDGMKRLVL